MRLAIAVAFFIAATLPATAQNSTAPAPATTTQTTTTGATTTGATTTGATTTGSAASTDDSPLLGAGQSLPPAEGQGSEAPVMGAGQALPEPPKPTNPPMIGPKLLIDTSMGSITVQLDEVHAPKSVANILRYVREKHYDGTCFYRVAKGFVIQMGSWTAKMKGRPVHKEPVPLEANNGLHNLRGTLALGREEAPDSARAEFFINLADNLGLDHSADDPGNTTGYAVFGQVIDGMDVVEAIGNVPTGDGGPMPGQWPLTPVIVKKVVILK